MQRYAERIGQLLVDGYITNRCVDVRLTPKGIAKLHEFIHNGYLVMANREDTVRLTQKGFSVLLACADRPTKPKKNDIKRIPVQRK
jgi:hypothetical protein